MPHTAVTLGGVACGASVLLATLIRWWFAEKHRFGALVPYALSMAYGMLTIITAGTAISIVGFLSWATLWGGNGIGSAGLVWGVGGHSPNVTRGHQLVLDDGGYVAVLLLTVVLVALWRWAPGIRNWKLATGYITGVCLGLSGTVAGIAAVPLASAANLIGAPFTVMIG